MASGSPSGYGGDGEKDVQQKFGYSVWIWTIGSALLIGIMIVMLVMSLGGFWSNDFVAPPV